MLSAYRLSFPSNMRAFIALSFTAIVLGKFVFFVQAQDSCDFEASDHASYIQNALHVQTLAAANDTKEAVAEELHEDLVAQAPAKKKTRGPKNVLMTATVYGA